MRDADAVRTVRLDGHLETGSPAREILAAGAIVGVVAGAVMALCLAVAAAGAGLGAAAPFEAMGATFVGPAADGGAGRIAYGLLLHLAVSVAVALPLAAVVPRDFPSGGSAVVGGGYALFILGFMTTAVVPALNPALESQMPVIGGAWVIAHAAYGVVIGLAPVVRRRLFAARFRPARAAARPARLPRRATT